ncbi:hypothetical protein [Gelidibacter japonicus]|uniref:hypothetical protein n=1 Tax=Gelidibacter japonicus TaxID=1962232 RepID=UPI003A9297D4
MKGLNVYYNKKTNKNRVQHLLRFLKNTEIKNNSWNIDRNEIVNNQINHNLFKKIHHLNQNLFYYKSVFDNKPIRKSYISTLKSIHKLNTIITLNYSYNLDKGFQSENYKKEIIKQYSNFQNYLEIYNSTVDDIEEKYLDLEKQFEETI